MTDWITADAKAWLQLDDGQLNALLERADSALGSFVAADGSIAFAMPANMVTATKT